MRHIKEEIKEVVHDGIWYTTMEIINSEIPHLPNNYSWNTIFETINVRVQRIQFVPQNN